MHVGTESGNNESENSGSARDIASEETDSSTDSADKGPQAHLFLGSELLNNARAAFREDAAMFSFSGHTHLFFQSALQARSHH